MALTLIRGGRLLDASQSLDRIGDLLLEGKRIVGIDVPAPNPDEVIDAQGCIVCPGLVDLHVNLREPGFEDDETIATGTAAALAGGITSVACLPNTSPVVDNRSEAEFIINQGERAGRINVFPLGAVTKDNAGLELAEMGQLVDAGVRAFTDGGLSIANAEIMRRALQYASMWDRPIFHRPQVPELVQSGVMHDGFVSTRLGLRGMPAAAEDIMVGRDIALAELTSGRVHLMCVSTKTAVEQIRQAKQASVRVTAEVAVHQLLLTDEELETFDANFKVDPPFRTQDHIQALIQGLQDGTIDAIVSDHQPYAPEKKARELDLVPFGISGLETLLPLSIQAVVEPGHLSWLEWINKLTSGPARILGINKGTLQAGADADVLIFDPERTWDIDPEQFLSKGRNTPFAGRSVRGAVRQVFVGGQLRYRGA